MIVCAHHQIMYICQAEQKDRAIWALFVSICMSPLFLQIQSLEAMDDYCRLEITTISFNKFWEKMIVKSIKILCESKIPAKNQLHFLKNPFFFSGPVAESLNFAAFLCCPIANPKKCDKLLKSVYNSVIHTTFIFACVCFCNRCFLLSWNLKNVCTIIMKIKPKIWY